MTTKVSRAELVDAARDLNDVLLLSPEIDVKLGVGELRSKVIEAAALIGADRGEAPGDAADDVARMKPATHAALRALRDEVLAAVPAARDEDIARLGLEAVMEQVRGALDLLEDDAGADAAEKSNAVSAAKPMRKRSKKTAVQKTNPERKPRAATNGGAKRRYGDADVIRLKVDKNPKQAGSAAHGRFEFYRDGMTCAQFLGAGGSRSDLSWDSKHGFIDVRPAA